MPVMTLAQLASHATRLAAQPLPGLSYVSEYVNVAYNIVALDMGVQHKPRETLAFASTSTDTTTAENRLGLPCDYDYAIDIKVGVPNSWSTATSRTTDWRPLAKVQAPWIDTAIAGRNSHLSGVPTDYADFATWLELSPSPNSAYSVQLRYSRKLSAMTLSTATPGLDEQWHWAIALKAAEVLAASQSDFSQEAANRGRYRSYMASVRLDQAKKHLDGRGMYVTFQRGPR
jgi:hypothetical protein